MTVVLLLLVTACVVWVAFGLASRRGSKDPLQTVDGFSRALHALAPDDDDDEDETRRGRQRPEPS